MAKARWDRGGRFAISVQGRIVVRGDHEVYATGKFRLVRDQVVQRGPSLKQQSERWIDAETGQVTVRTNEKGKERMTTNYLDLPDDVSNGLLFVLLKNVDPAAETNVSFVAASKKPRVVKCNILPGPEKIIKVGLIAQKDSTML